MYVYMCVCVCSWGGGWVAEVNKKMPVHVQLLSIYPKSICKKCKILSVETFLSAHMHSACAHKHTHRPAGRQTHTHRHIHTDTYSQTHTHTQPHTHTHRKQTDLQKPITVGEMKEQSGVHLLIASRGRHRAGAEAGAQLRIFAQALCQRLDPGVSRLCRRLRAGENLIQTCLATGAVKETLSARLRILHHSRFK